MWNAIILVGGLFLLVVGLLMVIGGDGDGWRRIGTGAMLVVAYFALRQGKRSKRAGEEKTT